MTLLRPSLATAVLGLAFALHSPASVAQSAGIVGANATNSCAGTLPVYQTQLRQRPLALTNEGTSSAFATCAFDLEGAFGGFEPVTAVYIYLTNSTGSTIDVNCTLVDGVEATLSSAIGGGYAPQYYAKTTSVAANSAGLAVWQATDYSLTTFSPFAQTSCLLQPGVMITLTGTNWGNQGN